MTESALPKVANVRVAVINRSSVVDDPEVNRVVAALQQQVSRHFSPIWGIDAQLFFYGRDVKPPADLWWLVVLDDTDQAGDLGYHDTTDQGLPLGKVFAKTDQVYQSQWSVTASHELLEMLGDPYINLAATQYPGNNGTYMSLYAYEVCDPCEADQYGYLIDGVLVSNFVFPTWFEGFWPPFGTQFDYKDKIQQPFQLLPGGFISVYDVQSGAGWRQLTGPTTGPAYSSRAQVGSRRERRRLPREMWERSRSPAGIAPDRPAAPPPAASQMASRVTDKSAREPNAAQRLRTAADLKQLGTQHLAAQEHIASDRNARLLAFVKQVQEPTESPGRATRSAAPSASGKRSLRILAEGDSWFDYPLPPSFGVVYELEKLLGYQIANMAHAGEQVRQMLGLAVRQEIVTRLSDATNVRYDAMLFSGGGNDLVGDPLATFLKNAPPALPPAQMLDDDALNSAIAVLEAEYRQLIQIRDRYSAETRVFVNCYDFPPVTGKGVCFQGPWLKPSLDYAYQQAGVVRPNPSDESLVIREMLRRFRAMLVKIASDPQVKGFYVVETQGTLLAGDADWANELHPTAAGFQKIARIFQGALQTVFP
jgi:hypothetical protein